VVESATEVGSALVWGSTKTDERRAVRLPRFLVELLAEHLAGRSHGLEDLVSTAPMGGPLRERKFLHGQLKPAAPAGWPARDAARSRPSAYGGEPAHPRGRQRQGDAAFSRPQVRGDDAGPLRASVARPSSSYAQGQVIDLALWWT
jgi:hypothetical protein